MDVILLERIAKLGQMGDQVRVKDGYARNFLLPSGKALRATQANKKRFESQRIELEARNLELKREAEAVAEKLAGKSFILIRQAGETGQLYGSVSSRDIAEVVTAGGFTTNRNQIVLKSPIKTIGLHEVPVHLHAEVEVPITINVARSPEEAERQAKGEAIECRRRGLHGRSRPRSRRRARRSRRRGRLTLEPQTAPTASQPLVSSKSRDRRRADDAASQSFGEECRHAPTGSGSVPAERVRARAAAGATSWQSRGIAKNSRNILKYAHCGLRSRLRRASTFCSRCSNRCATRLRLRIMTRR